MLKLSSDRRPDKNKNKFNKRKYEKQKENKN